MATAESSTDIETEFFLLFKYVAKRIAKKNRLTEEDMERGKSAITDPWKEPPWNKFRFSGIDYDNASHVCAYLRKYASSHTEITTSAVEKFFRDVPDDPIRNVLMKRTHFRIVSVGGGPGNDIISCACVLLNQPFAFRCLDLTVIDQKGWANAFDHTMSVIKNDRPESQIGQLLQRVKVDHSSITSDLAVDDYESSEVIGNADVVLMVKMLSVIPREGKKAKILKNIFSQMKPYSIFFYVDTDANFVVNESLDYNMEVISQTSRETHVPHTSEIWKTTYEVCVLQKDRDSYIVRDDTPNMFDSNSSSDENDEGVIAISGMFRPSKQLRIEMTTKYRLG